MQNANSATTLRRSSRVPAALPVLVTSLEGTQFSEVCETLVVNAHGCSILTRVKLDAGVPLHLHSKEGREATAHVVSCQPIDTARQSWRLGAKLDRPQNFWGLADCPKDWALPSVLVQPRLSPTVPTPTPLSSHKVPVQDGQPSAAVLDRLARQLETQVAKMIAEAVRPVQAELSAIKEKLARKESNPSRFEVSLSSIPPELEQQLELRLRNDFGPKITVEVQQQAAQVLAGAKAAIDQRTTKGYEEFMQRVAGELKQVEKRAQDLSTHISGNAREHIGRSLDEFQQKLLEGGNSLKRLSEELLEFLRQTLSDEHNAHRADLQQLRAFMQSDLSNLQEQFESLESRLAKLNASAESLESGLDQRLSQMSSNIARDTRKQLEAEANELLDEMTARGVSVLGKQLDEATGNMKIAQNGIVASASESLKSEAGNALQAFEHSMQTTAKLSVERWRLKMAAALNALARNLGDQFNVDESSDNKSERRA